MSQWLSEEGVNYCCIQRLDTPSGQLVITSYTVTNKQDTYSVAYVDYMESLFTQKDIKTILDQSCAGAVQNADAQSDKQEDFLFAGRYPGRHLYYSGVERKMKEHLGKVFFGRADIIIVKPRLYQIGYLSSNKDDLSKPEVLAFFASFKIVSKDVGNTRPNYLAPNHAFNPDAAACGGTAS